MTSPRHVWPGRLLRGLLAAAVATLVLLALAVRLGPMFGHEVFVIRGGSMSPALPFGAVVIADRTAPEAVTTGEVISFRGTNGAVVTHRVIEVLVEEGERLFRTKGDASAAADPHPVPEGAVIGVVNVSVPYLGYAFGMLAQPLGLLSLGAAAIAIYVAISLVADLRSRPGRRPDPLDLPNGITA